MIGDSMKKITSKDIDRYYKTSYLIILTLTIYAFITIFKVPYFRLYGLTFKNLSNIEQQISTITYQTFAISLSLTFYIKHMKENMNELRKYTKGFIIGMSTIFLYMLRPIIRLIILIIEKINPNHLSTTSQMIYIIVFEITIASIIALINNEKLIKNIKDFKKNYKTYLQKYLPYYILGLIIMMTSNIIINNLTGTIAGNEQSVQNLLVKAPLYMFIQAAILAPFMEEMVFRQSIRNIITNKTTFIIASGLIFGGLHVIGNISTIYDILYIIPYATPGIIFAYILTKTDNIFVPISIHFIHNFLLITLQIILLTI
jgi:membrane protease YdiL (CAAX protease family)